MKNSKKKTKGTKKKSPSSTKSKKKIQNNEQKQKEIEKPEIIEPESKKLEKIKDSFNNNKDLTNEKNLNKSQSNFNLREEVDNPIHKLLQEKQNNIDPDLLHIISSNLSDKSKNQISDENNEKENNEKENNDINKKKLNKIILLNNNDFTYKEAKANTVKDNNKKIDYINFNFINRPKDPVTQKIIKNLRINEKEVVHDLSKIMQNEKLLKNQSYLQLINNNPNNINLDKKRLELELKLLNDNKKGYMMRLDQIKLRIKQLEDKYERQQGIFDNERKENLNKLKNKLSNLIMNQSNDELNIKIKKLKNENIKLLANMQNDIEKNLIKKINEFEKTKKEEEQNKLLLIKKIRDEERKEIIKRKNKMSEETKKLNQFINKKPEIKKYLYQKINNTFQEMTNKRILQENNKRKIIMKPIMEDEMNEMMRNYKIYKNKRNLEIQENTQKLKKSWSERNMLIPTYKTQLKQLIEEEDHNMKVEKENEIEKKKEMKNNQINYSKKLEDKKVFIQKQINEKNKNKDEETILKNRISPKPPLIMSNINIYSNLIREKLFLKQNNKSQDNIKLPNNKDFLNKNNTNNKYTILKSKALDISDKIRKANMIKLPNLNMYKINNIINLNNNENDNNSNKNNRNISIIKGTNNSVTNKNKNSKTIQVENVDYKGTKEIQKLIEKNGFDRNTLEMANSKLERLSEKQKQKSLLLKCEGGFVNNPGLGEEVCDILIDSMTAKLSLINEMDKIQYNKNKKKPKLVDESSGPGGNININDNNNDDDNEENEDNDYSSFNKENRDEY